MTSTIHKSVLSIRQSEGAMPAIALAVGLHVALVLAAFVVPRFFDKPPPLRKPVIARLVALGKPRDKSLMPRKEAPPPSGGGPAVAPIAPTPGAGSKKAAVAPKTAPVRHQPTRQELMEKALAKAAGRRRDDEPREKPDPDRAGQENGSPEGTAEESEAGDAYFTAVHDAIQANYVVPSVVSERERMALSAEVLIYIGPQGQMLKHTIQKKSGNPLIDSALEVALQKTKLPAPPPELARQLRDEGVLLNFHP